jgi:hypothetical protein
MLIDFTALLLRSNFAVIMETLAAPPPNPRRRFVSARGPQSGIAAPYPPAAPNPASRLALSCDSQSSMCAMASGIALSEGAACANPGESATRGALRHGWRSSPLPSTRYFAGDLEAECETPDFHRKPKSLYHCDSPWISGYHVQNVSQIDTQSHTSHHIKLIVN